MIQFDDLTFEKAKDILKTPSNPGLNNFYDSQIKLSEDQINGFAEDGYVKIENVVSSEFLPRIKKIIQSSVLIRKGKDERELKDKSQYEQSLLQCGYLCWDFPAVKDFVFAKRFASIARDLLKVDHVRLWHDQALFKRTRRKNDRRTSGL